MSKQLLQSTENTKENDSRFVAHQNSENGELRDACFPALLSDKLDGKWWLVAFNLMFVIIQLNFFPIRIRSTYGRV